MEFVRPCCRRLLPETLPLRGDLTPPRTLRVENERKGDVGWAASLPTGLPNDGFLSECVAARNNLLSETLLKEGRSFALLARSFAHYNF